MNKKMYIIFLCILVSLLTACSKIDDNDMLQQNDLNWLDKSTSASSENITLDEDSEPSNISPENSTSDDNNSSEKNIVTSSTIDMTELSVGSNLNILSSKNMPLATDTLLYNGNDMEYGACIENTCSYTADYTFFIVINGYLQPFILEGNEKEAYSANFILEPNEEKIIHFTFTPIIAPYEEKALVSFMGMVVNMTPVISDLSMVYMNSNSVNYNMYLKAENISCQITMAEKKNVMGNAIEELELSSSGEDAQVRLSDRKENSQTISLVRTEEFSSDNTITAYASRINNSTLRAFLWCEGEFLPVFNGEYYADIPDNEYALYEIPIDNSLIKNNSNQRYNMLYIDMSRYQEINDDNCHNNYVGRSQIYVIS